MQNFLSECVQRGKATGSTRSRQLVNAEKVMSEYVSKEAKKDDCETIKDGNTETKNSDEISTKLRVILEKKLSDEKERGESSK